MKHINIAIENMNNSTIVKEEENLSIIERIMQKTGNPKIAAVLALDLFLVGVDTVRTLNSVIAVFISIVFTPIDCLFYVTLFRHQ